MPNAYGIAVPNGNGNYCVGCNSELTNDLKKICSLCYKDPWIGSEYKHANKQTWSKHPNMFPLKTPWMHGSTIDVWNNSPYRISGGAPWRENNPSYCVPPNTTTPTTIAPTQNVLQKKYDADAALADWFRLAGILPIQASFKDSTKNKSYNPCSDCGLPLVPSIDVYYGKDPEKAKQCNNCRKD